MCYVQHSLIEVWTSEHEIWWADESIFVIVLLLCTSCLGCAELFCDIICLLNVEIKNVPCFKSCLKTCKTKQNFQLHIKAFVSSNSPYSSMTLKTHNLGTCIVILLLFFQQKVDFKKVQVVKWSTCSFCWTMFRKSI